MLLIEQPTYQDPGSIRREISSTGAVYTVPERKISIKEVCETIRDLHCMTQTSSMQSIVPLLRFTTLYLTLTCRLLLLFFFF